MGTESEIEGQLAILESQGYRVNRQDRGATITRANGPAGMVIVRPYAAGYELVSPGEMTPKRVPARLVAETVALLLP